MRSSGIQKIPNRLENTATNSQSYQASSISCGQPTADKIQVKGQLQLENGSRLNGLPIPQSSDEPVTLGYLQTQQQYAQSDVNVGTIQIWFKTTIPGDYLLCNGSAFNIGTYPELYQVLGTNVLPDLRNQFIRGASSSVGQQISQSNVPIGVHSHYYDKYTQLITFTSDKIYAPLDEARTYISNISSLYIPTLTQVAGNDSSQFYPAHMTVHFIIKARSTRAFRNSIQNDSLATASLIANVDRLFANIQLDLNNNKIINVQTPTNDTDVATKFYVDQSIAGGGLINKLQNGVQSLILQPSELQTTVNLNMQSNKITNLSNATSNQDALNLITADNRYYSNLLRLNQLLTPTSSLNLNSQKIINLADATLATDGLNRQTGDSRYYLNTTPLQSITTPTNQLNMNAQKISNMATGTLFNDAVILQQLQQWIALTTTINQTPTSNTWTLSFQEITQTSTQYLIYSSLTNRITLSQSGIFNVQILIKATYTNFNQPIQFQINSTGGIISRSVTQQQPTSNNTLTTTQTQFIVNAQAGEFWVEIVSNPSVITINSGCYLLAMKMY